MSQPPKHQRSKSDLIQEARRTGCIGCVFFAIADPADSKGHCRRSAPTREARTDVPKDYWCGEFLPA